MKKTSYIIGVLLIIWGCNSVKRNQKLLSQGNYEAAIDLAVKKLQKDKSSEKYEPHILFLEDAFDKMVQEDTRRIDFLKKSNTSDAAKQVYYTYQNIDFVQNKIRPLLPLYSKSLDRNAVFRFDDYSDEILGAKDAYVAYLYTEAAQYMSRNTIQDYRTAYHVYCELEEVQENYRDVAQQKRDARFYGTNHIHVSINNNSYQILPYLLQEELLNFNTYGLNDFWTAYHAQKEQNITYTYGITLNLLEISVAPEQLFETLERREKRIIDGWEYQYDRKGNIKTDSIGNELKKPIYKTITARITYTDQLKAAFIGGNIIYKNLHSNNIIDRFPIAGEFVFEHSFARYRGDVRALTIEDRQFIKNDYIPFPSNEQMIFDTGEDLKIRLKTILNNNTF
jgi:hypothetical protein